MTMERALDTASNGRARYVLHKDVRHAEKMYCTEFTVIGRGHFPYDMLRHDMCHPVDSTGMHFDYGETADDETRSVRLRTWSQNKFWRPCYARWASFGWQVTTDVFEMQQKVAS